MFIIFSIWHFRIIYDSSLFIDSVYNNIYMSVKIMYSVALAIRRAVSGEPLAFEPNLQMQCFREFVIQMLLHAS